MTDKFEPLTESYFYILLCLYEGPKHGYGIMQRAEELSGGSVRIGPGTMYGAVSNMLGKGWIVECPQGEGFQRRRLYRVTDAGRNVLLGEVERLRSLIKIAGFILDNDPA